MQLAIAVIIVLTFAYCVKRHGLISFVTLGSVGMAIYSIPGLMGLEMPFWVAATTNERFLLDTPAASDWILMVAWVSFLVGAMFTASKEGVRFAYPPLELDWGRLALTARACVLLSIANYAYIAAKQGPLFFLAARADQEGDAITLISKWFVAIGLVSALLISNRKMMAFLIAMLGTTFLAGDRTMVAIITAAAVVVLGHKSGGPRALLKGPVAPVLGIAAVIVVFGKPIYTAVKSFFGFGSFESGTSIEATLLAFEPLGIYSHLSYVMDTKLRIGFLEFLTSVLGNALIVPSTFGVSTNLYNELVQGSFTFNVTYGVAGSYLAHGWAVGGVIGVILFYLAYVFGLRLCDRQFAKQSGLRKAMIACAGGVLAFYAHRNGMDNLGSFMRQIALAGLIVAFVGAGLRAFSSQPQDISAKPI
jgi:hypothetical protein